ASEVDRERALLVQERLTLEDRPASLTAELFARALYGEHPCALPLSGTPASLEQLTPDRLRAHHRRFADLSRLVLAVVGDVKAEEVLARAEAAFGSSKRASEPLPSVPAVKPPSQPRVERRELPREQAQLA